MSVNNPKEISQELREYAERYSDPTDELMRDAADTIDELFSALSQAYPYVSQAANFDNRALDAYGAVGRLLSLASQPQKGEK